jgi:hypothetical protein
MTSEIGLIRLNQNGTKSGFNGWYHVKANGQMVSGL